MARVPGDEVSLTRDQARQRLQMCLGAELTKPKLQQAQQPPSAQGQGQGVRISFRRGSCQYLPLSANNSSQQYTDILSPTTRSRPGFEVGEGRNVYPTDSRALHASQSMATLPMATSYRGTNSPQIQAQSSGENPPGNMLAYRVNYGGEKPSARPSPSPLPSYQTMTSYQSPTNEIASFPTAQMTSQSSRSGTTGYDPEVNVLSYTRPSPSSIEGRMSSVMSPTGFVSGAGGRGVPLMTILATRPRLAQRRPSEDLTALRRQAYMRQLGLGSGQGHAASLDISGGQLPTSAEHDDLMSRSVTTPFSHRLVIQQRTPGGDTGYHGKQGYGSTTTRPAASDDRYSPSATWSPHQSSGADLYSNYDSQRHRYTPDLVLTADTANGAHHQPDVVPRGFNISWSSGDGAGPRVGINSHSGAQVRVGLGDRIVRVSSANPLRTPEVTAAYGQERPAASPGNLLNSNSRHRVEHYMSAGASPNGTGQPPTPTLPLSQVMTSSHDSNTSSSEDSPRSNSSIMTSDSGISSSSKGPVSASPRRTQQMRAHYAMSPLSSPDSDGRYSDVSSTGSRSPPNSPRFYQKTNPSTATAADVKASGSSSGSGTNLFDKCRFELGTVGVFGATSQSPASTPGSSGVPTYYAEDFDDLLLKLRNLNIPIVPAADAATVSVRQLARLNTIPDSIGCAGAAASDADAKPAELLLSTSLDNLNSDSATNASSVTNVTSATSITNATSATSANIASSAISATSDSSKSQQLTINRRENLRKTIEAFNNGRHGIIITLDQNNNTFQGFLRVYMNLIRPVSMSLSSRPPSIYDCLPPKRHSEPANGTQLSTFRLPKDTAKVIHVLSTTTVQEVIRILLGKFHIVDNPHKFALYEKQELPCSDGSGKPVVKMSRLSADEKPLLLCLQWTRDLGSEQRFVLQENDTGEIVWDVFSQPELDNFLRLLNREEKAYIRQIRRKYQLLRVGIDHRLRESERQSLQSPK